MINGSKDGKERGGWAVVEQAHCTHVTYSLIEYYVSFLQDKPILKFFFLEK